MSISALLKETRDTAIPFVLVGFVTGLIQSCQFFARNDTWLYSYLRFADININWKSVSLAAFAEHAAPNTLSFLLIAVYMISALHKIVFGEVSRKGTLLSNAVLAPLAAFAVSLASAMLGLLIGLAVVSLFSSPKMAAVFAFTTVYPLSYIFLLHVGISVIYNDRDNKVIEWVEEGAPRPLRSRVEGLYLVVVGTLVITFHKHVFNLLHSIGESFGL